VRLLEDLCYIGIDPRRSARAKTPWKMTQDSRLVCKIAKPEEEKAILRHVRYC